MVCPSDTPEGEGCGLVKNLALMSHVSLDEDEEPIRRIAYSLGVAIEDAQMFHGVEFWGKNSYLFMLNGNVLGFHRRPRRYCQVMRKLRQNGMQEGYFQ